MLINPYSPNTTFKNFPDLDAKLLKHYDRLFDTVSDLVISPRYFYESGLKIGFRDICYYIDQLYNNQPESVIDVGCGECVWKNWFPNIVGFDPNKNEFSKQDFVDFFDEDFSRVHAKNWTCGMALNSLHFIDWSEVPKQIDLAMNLVKDQFLFTFNFNKFSNNPNLPLSELILLFDQTLVSVPYTIKLLDYPTLRGFPQSKIDHWAHINGHVRFILQHKQ
jgi:hypothetical protein